MVLCQKVLIGILDVQELRLVDSKRVNYYQGESLSQAVIYQRYQSEKSHRIGECVSVLVDVGRQLLLGLTRMQLDLSGTQFSREFALQSAFDFLNRVAPDLVKEAVVVPHFTELSPNERMIFTPALQFGEVELHWIGQHFEIIRRGKVDKEIVGMKVKMRIPATGLWAWVIVGKQGEIITFERDVSWNFDHGIRETPMWLHDQWLVEHMDTLG